MTTELEQKAINKFGITDDITKAGYILRDGTMLNFRRGFYADYEEGVPSPFREHGEIYKIMPESSLYKKLIPNDINIPVYDFELLTGAGRTIL